MKYTKNILVGLALSSVLGANNSEVQAEESTEVEVFTREFNSRLFPATGKIACRQAFVPNTTRDLSQPNRSTSIAYIGSNNEGREYLRFSDSRFGSPTPRITPPFPNGQDLSLELPEVVIFPDTPNPIVPSSISTLYNTNYNTSASFIGNNLVYFAGGRELSETINPSLVRLQLPNGIQRVSIHGLSSTDSTNSFALATFFSNSGWDLIELEVDFENREVHQKLLNVDIDTDYFIESCSVTEFALMSGLGNRQVVICTYGNSSTSIGDTVPIVLHRTNFNDGNSTEFIQTELSTFYEEFFDESLAFKDNFEAPLFLNPRSRHEGNARQIVFDMPNSRFLYHLDCIENDLECSLNSNFNAVTGECDFIPVESPEVEEDHLNEDSPSVIELRPVLNDFVYMPNFRQPANLVLDNLERNEGIDAGYEDVTEVNQAEKPENNFYQSRTESSGCAVVTGGAPEEKDIPLGIVLGLAAIVASTKKRALKEI